MADKHAVLQQLTAEDIQIGSRATRVALDSGENGEWNFYTPRPGATLTPSQADPTTPANAT